MKHLDLFSGKGTFVERAKLLVPDYECVGVCEIDPFAQSLLIRHVEKGLLFDDIRSFQPSPSLKVDLLTGGFPCQDISIAKGKNARGLAGEKSGLWREMERCIRVLRPTYVVIENTSALLRRGLDTILANLATMRYDAVWTMLSAAQCGYPHRRKRLFICAFNTDRIGREEVQFFARTITKISQEEETRRKNIQQFRRLSGEGFWREDYAEFCRVDNGYSAALNSARLRIIGNAIIHENVDIILKSILFCNHFPEPP